MTDAVFAPTHKPIDAKEVSVPEKPGLKRETSLTLANWQEAPHNRWAFAHVDEIVPTVTIRRQTEPRNGTRPATSLPSDLDQKVPGLATFLDDSFTDAFIVVRNDEIVYERYFGGFAATDRHLLMSVSKSLCGLTIGRLVGRGLLDPRQTVAHYVPELAASAYGDATVQQVLDMTVAVEYNEDYQDPSSQVQAQDRVAGWRPRLSNDPADTYDFLTTLRKSGQHGERFQYCSAGTDVLAWVVESVTARRYSDVLATEIWSLLGCDDDAIITVDHGGFAFANGGVACTARDLTRLGRLMLTSGELDGTQIVPSAWVTDTIRGGDPIAAKGSVYQRVHANGSYRNQWWVTGNNRGSFYAAGIHGQFIWVDPPSGTVIVKFSSWPEPITEAWSRSHAKAFLSVGEALTQPF